MEWNHLILLLLFYPYLLFHHCSDSHASALVLRCAHISSSSVFMFVVLQSR